MSSSVVDMELKKAFSEMQVNKMESTKKLMLLDLKVEALKKTVQRIAITEKEVSNLTPDTKVYASVGRMFCLSTVPLMSEDLKSNQVSIESLIKLHDDQKQYLMKTLKDKEDNLRELVQQRKEADSK